MFKGYRIRKYHSKILLILLSVVHLIVGIVLGLLYYFLFYEKLELVLSLVILVGGLFLFEIAFFVLWRRSKMNGSFLTSLKHMDYLGKMVMNNRMYVSKKVTATNGRAKEKIVYFPKIYYRRKNGYITVRFPTDLQANQERFLKIGANLEHAFFGDMVAIVNEQDYIRYKLLYSPKHARLNVEKISLSEGQVPLMKEYNWNYIKFPHALISGVTGGGKSFFMMYLLKVFVALGFKCEICDFKMADMSYFQTIPSFNGHVFDTKNGIDMCIRKFREDMEERKVELKELSGGQSGLDYRDFKMTPRVLFFDEYVAYLSSLDFKEQNKIMENLKQIILLGRQLGFYLVMGMQRPDAKFLPDGMRDQFGLRVTLGKMQPQGYAMVFGDSDKAYKDQGEEVKAWGYAYSGGSYVRQLFAPLVPKGYDFVQEVATLLGESTSASETESQAVDVADVDSPAINTEAND
ncbi:MULTISPECIES: hypothetical protein [unclassified Enterococcus]|uniref:hypothetical protein n=1 Tax=unclassified Enterococcus TaxID=2608891 RepID=UPI00190741C7|nr:MULTISPECIES: hypothetical protein [unclassified Enterococcus]MBK0036044.1 ATP-binding protein [Enterococcus sp. S52]MBK0068702.1 ATP-binding protein [Enterococcus sp. S53]MBK0139295.1 ATP-binding protein [Enterococcus sp. S76]MBK0142930.1 ATP-binding protein [Enterococcus sp. S77]